MVAPLLARALDLLYPPRCVACGAFGQTLCVTCASALVPASGTGRCPNCGAGWVGEGNCPTCYPWEALAGARAAFEMAGPARRVVHGLKFRGIRELAAHMAEALQPLVDELRPDAIFPIPLHRGRRRRRGFNQAEVLLNRLAVPAVAGRLDRIRDTASQVGLRERERQRNVAGAFRYRGPELSGLPLALLDDVVTTGAPPPTSARAFCAITAPSACMRSPTRVRRTLRTRPPANRPTEV